MNRREWGEIPVHNKPKPSQHSVSRTMDQAARWGKLDYTGQDFAMQAVSLKSPKIPSFCAQLCERQREGSAKTSRSPSSIWHLEGRRVPGNMAEKMPAVKKQMWLFGPTGHPPLSWRGTSSGCCSCKPHSSNNGTVYPIWIALSAEMRTLVSMACVWGCRNF